MIYTLMPAGNIFIAIGLAGKPDAGKTEFLQNWPRYLVKAFGNLDIDEQWN